MEEVRSSNLLGSTIFNDQKFNKNNFRAVENRLAVDFNQLDLPVSEEVSLEILGKQKIFGKVFDIVEFARSRIGKTFYKRGARSIEWPEFLDCSSFTKWLYGQIGIWLPRYSIDQRESGQQIGDLSEIKTGDLIFTNGYRNYYWDNQTEGVGHVGMATSTNSIIHAADSKHNIVENYLDIFLKSRENRGICRIADLPNTITLVMPPNDILESSSEVRWRILQNLK